jgi:alpha-galactosidase
VPTAKPAVVTAKPAVVTAAVLAAAALVTPLVRPSLAYALDNGLACTPYLGWNTYYGLGSAFDAQTIQSEADTIVSRGLKDTGYRCVWIDGGWWSGTRNAAGNITVDPGQWPHGMEAVADYIHDKGLLAGIYTDPRRPDPATGTTPTTLGQSWG